MTQDEFMAEVEAFLSAHRIAPSDFGVAAVNDRSFVFDLRNKDRSPSLKTVERVREYMATYANKADAA